VTGNYSRALNFLTQHNLLTGHAACKYLAGQCLVKQGKYDEALSILGDKNPVHLITAPGSARRKHLHVRDKLRNGTKHDGAAGRSDRIDRSEERDAVETSAIRYEAAMCYLRGLCHAKVNAFDRAKECYKDAVRIDVQCFEAFDQLMKNSLMSPTEEWEFLQSLNFDSISSTTSTPLDPSTTQQAAEFTRLLYITRLSKYERPQEFTSAIETLSTHYNLSANPDILLSRASLLFTQCRFRPCFALTTRILQLSPNNFSVFLPNRSLQMFLHTQSQVSTVEKHALQHPTTIISKTWYTHYYTLIINPPNSSPCKATKNFNQCPPNSKIPRFNPHQYRPSCSPPRHYNPPPPPRADSPSHRHPHQIHSRPLHPQVEAAN